MTFSSCRGRSGGGEDGRECGGGGKWEEGILGGGFVVDCVDAAVEDATSSENDE